MTDYTDTQELDDMKDIVWALVKVAAIALVLAFIQAYVMVAFYGLDPF